MTQTQLTKAEARLRASRETLAALVDERAAFDRRSASLADERERIAFAAHTGDKAARKRLDEIHAEAARQASERTSIDAATAEARRRLASADAAQRTAAEAERAREVLAALKEFREHGARLDEAAAAILAAYGDFQDSARSIRGLGVAHPSESLLRVSCRRALIAALIGTDLEVDLLAPNERRTFAELVTSWARTIEGWAGPRLAAERDETTIEEAA